VEFIARQTVLPPDPSHRFDDNMFWSNLEANRHGVKIIN
jgi:hypothetical protein